MVNFFPLLVILHLLIVSFSWSPSIRKHQFNQRRLTKTSLNAGDVSRRSILRHTISGIVVVSTIVPTEAQASDDDEDELLDFSTISSRASKISQEIVEEEGKNSSPSPKPIIVDGRTAYDFSLPVAGEIKSFGDLVKQNDDKSKVKAILVVNMKQDDPIARKDIPEFISLASKYGQDGEFVVVMSPTDQGYYEPDTSALIRLKLASEYGYGINPVTTLTDKMILLGTGSHPFWRWLQGTCRTPSGLGRIQGNFEKFLVDGRTGLPVRRYPRKYMPNDMADDIESLLSGRTLPPAGSNFNEEWRIAANDALRDTYRFQKGLNVFDQ